MNYFGRTQTYEGFKAILEKGKTRVAKQHRKLSACASVSIMQNNDIIIDCSERDLLTFKPDNETVTINRTVADTWEEHKYDDILQVYVPTGKINQSVNKHLVNHINEYTRLYLRQKNYKLVMEVPGERTPEKWIKCSECHGMEWTEENKALMALTLTGSSRDYNIKWWIERGCSSCCYSFDRRSLPPKINEEHPYQRLIGGNNKFIPIETPCTINLITRKVV